MTVFDSFDSGRHEGQPGEHQVVLRQHYGLNDIPRNEEKSLEGQVHAEHFGYLFDGMTAGLRISGKRALELLSIGLFILNGDLTFLLVLQVFAGKMAHTLQLRRPLWSLSAFCILACLLQA